MPALDGIGPQGAGPMTGRGMGYCGSLNQPDFALPDPGFRSGFGFGGRGWQHRFYTTNIPDWVIPTPEQEITCVNTWADQLKSQLDAKQKRIEELKS